MTGGISSDIWRVDLPSGSLCVKRALAQLKSAAEWHVSTERSASEYAWLSIVAAIAPAAVPKLLGQSDNRSMFAMDYLDPARAPVWKAELFRGAIDPDVAAQVGDLVGRIHAATAARDDIARNFQNHDLFEALRLRPYLRATATCHPDIGDHLLEIADRTAATCLTLIHGDVSPKNILVGKDGPLLLDAECACYGDPAFDLAFCLNHLLLKAAVMAGAQAPLAAAAKAMTSAYNGRVDWETVAAFEKRCATLLPALTLARVDGDSPVEYLSGDDAVFVRDQARRILMEPGRSIENVIDRWFSALAAR
ncbi:MAG: aminoglycoside phosphotransferase family protein [Sphingomonadaceae bacterium]|nr:aminoglycoside phosphotransferase family protein [Sphingomonadaceae bacterium]